MIKKSSLLYCFLITFISSVISSVTFADEPKSAGKYKKWEAFIYTEDKGKVCFAQTIPKERSPKALKREASRLFVTFRKAEKIKNEISVTSGHIYRPSSVTAKSGKHKFELFSQGSFAWMLDGEEEFNLIKTMKKASKLAITATAKNGNQTKDLYSMMGFTKAYNAAKKSCA